MTAEQEEYAGTTETETDSGMYICSLHACTCIRPCLYSSHVVAECSAHSAGRENLGKRSESC